MVAVGPVIVSSDGFTRCAGRHLGVAGVATAVRTRLASVEDLAMRVKCPEAAASIAKAGPLLRDAANQLEMSHLVFAERAKWARIAEHDPAVRKYLTTLMSYGADAVNFMTVSAMGGAKGLRMLAARWPTMTQRMGYRQVPFVETLVLRSMAEVRASKDFVYWETSINQQIVFKARRYGTAKMPVKITEWDLRLNKDLARKFDSYAASAAKHAQNAEEFSKWVDGKWGMKGAGIGTLLKFWELSQSDFYTDRQKAKILVVTAGSEIAIWALAGMATLGCATFSGPLAVGCGAAVLGGSVAGSYAVGKAIDQHWSEDKPMELKKYREDVAPHVWEVRQREFVSGEYHKLPVRHLETLAYNAADKQYPSNDALGDPQGHADFERFRVSELARLDEAYRKSAENAFYRSTNWPPRDPVDRLRVAQQDEAMWKAKMDEIRQNKTSSTADVALPIAVLGASSMTAGIPTVTPLLDNL